MKKILTGLFILLVSLVSTTADAFDIPANNTWVKVQDKEIVQWSIIPIERTRIDLISYDTAGKRTTYYLVRNACGNGKMVTWIIRPGNKIGFGFDCDGNLVEMSNVLVDKVQKSLPVAAVALLKQ